MEATCPSGLRHWFGAPVLRDKAEGWSRKISCHIIVNYVNVFKKRAAGSDKAHLLGTSVSRRSCELAAALEGTKVDLCTVREAGWDSNKLKIIGPGFETVYNNGSQRARNGLGTVVSQLVRDRGAAF